MTANKPVRGPFGAILVAALVAAMVSLLVFVQGGEAAPAADGQPSPKIVGGKPVPDGKYPFMVALDIAITEGKETGEGLCGGTLIDPDSVLTAAHCFYNVATGKPWDKVQVQAYVGRTVRSSNQGQVRTVKDIDVHPNFQLRLVPKRGLVEASYDAAVLELSRPVSGIEPIELATPSQNDLEWPGRKATVTGWGNMIAQVDEPGVPGPAEIPDRMQEAQVPIVSDSRAAKLVGPLYVPPLMVAAGGMDKITCQGDSGGPLFSALASDGDGDNGDDNNGDDNNGDDKNRRGSDGGSGGKFTQFGIASFGPIGCLVKEKHPAAYTEVNNPSVRSFIANAASK